MPTAAQTDKTSAATLGVWGETIDLGVVPVAMALLPNGNIVAWASDFPTSFQGDVGLTPTNTWSVVFNPLTGKTSDAIDTGVAADMFCPGISYLADGRILVNGGDSSFHTALYSDTSGPLGTWTNSGNMNIARGYNATVTLSNGEVFTIGGSWSGGPEPKNGELWNPATGQWSLTGISDAAATYTDALGNSADPIDISQGWICFGDSHNWLFAMPNGLVFDAGPKPQMNMIDPAGGTWWSVGNRGDDAYSINGIAVMYEQGKILKAGGAPSYTGETDGTPTIAAYSSAYVIDLTKDYLDPHAAPTVTRISNLNEARAFANGVVLPNGEVFIVGGQSNPVVFSDKYAVLTPEIWDPKTLQFTNLAPLPVPRDYHSAALLLGDGSVIVGGGGLCGGCAANFAEAGLTVDLAALSADHADYNIYRPTYLFNADGSDALRPVLSKTPDKLVLGTELIVKASADTVAFSLVRFAATTHDIDTDQRRVSLTIDSKNADGTVSLNVPSDPGITVPGYWMLFALNAHDTPSIAATVQVLPPGSVLPPVDPPVEPPVTPPVEPPVTPTRPTPFPGEVVLHGSSGDYIITNNAGVLHIEDTVAGRDGVQDLPHVTMMQFADGDGVFDPSGAAETVARLYQAALDRQPEMAGLQYWTAQRDSAHVPLSDIANAFTRSPEFITHYGNLADDGFVQQLYQNVLNRAGEAAGAQYWQALLATGVNRGTVLLGFSQSAEFQAKTLATGGDAETAETYRLYRASLGRVPDAAGAQYWSAQLAGGASPEQVAQGFVGSPEFQHNYGALNASDFVAALYNNILHRAGDTGGQQYWSDVLQHGGSQASVVVGFADSPENRAMTAKATHADWVFIPAAP